MGNTQLGSSRLLEKGFSPPLDYAEAAAYLGCKESTLRVWVSRRRVPHIKVGALCRFRTQDLDGWLEERTVPADPEA